MAKFTLLSVIAAIFTASVTLFIISKLNINEVKETKQAVLTQTVEFPAEYTKAAWVWEYPTKLLEKLPQVLDFCQSEGVNTLFVNIDEYLDIYEMPKGDVRNQKMQKYSNALKQIVHSSKQRNIKVHALTGNTKYSYETYNYIPPLIVDHVFDFNQQNTPDTLDGIHFDIEFYRDKHFDDDRNYNTLSFLKLVSALTKKTKSLNAKYGQEVSLGFDIPFWFDDGGGKIPVITWDKNAKPLSYHLIDTLSQLPNSQIVIMAYRNRIEGVGGVIDLSGNEIQYADATGVGVLIGQELQDNEDKKITLFGKSRSEIKKYLITIIDKLKSHKSFRGIAIHDLDAFMETE